MRRGVRRGLVLLASGTIIAGAMPALAQYVPVQAPPGVQPLPPAPGAELRGYLSALAENPQNLAALIGAGRAALDMGDPEAALNFFSRADQISPRNPRVKAGMAATLAELGQPQPALRLFADALSLGAPEVEIQADRGLAYDMAGEPRRAQQDYLAVLRRRDDPETRRNLALSLAISGQREAALHLIDPQLRRNERAAWRTQAFVLALTGDTLGATRTAQAMMPAGAQEMAPFLARLHGLSPAEKAMAVHLGRFPAAGRTQMAHADVAPDPAAVAFALGRPQIAAARPAPATTRTNTPRTTATARRTTPPRVEPRVGTSLDPHGSFSTTRTPPRPAPARPALDSSDPYGLRGPAQTRPQPQPVRPQAARTETLAPSVELSRTQNTPAQATEQTTRWAGAPYPNAGQPTVAAWQPPVAVQPSPPAIQPSALAQVTAAQSEAPPQIAAEVPAGSGSRINTSPPPITATPSSTITEVALPPASPPPPVTMMQPEAPAASASGLTDIAEVVNSLTEEPQRAAPAANPPVRVAAAPPRTPPARATASRTAEPRTARARTPAPPPNPSRHWVQIATGAERSALPREFARLKALAPDQLGRRAAFTAPLRATNRLLVGPFAGDDEAQAFVNQLRRRNVSAFVWTSAAGQEIERLQTR